MVPDSDITILGGGPVGTTLALLLARLTPRPERIVLCRPERAVGPGPAVADTSSPDPRVMALNHGSRVLLQSLGAWPEGGADIADIHVSQRGRLGRTHISHADFGVDALGTVQSYAAIMQALADPLAASGVTVRAGAASIVSQDDSAVHLIQGDLAWTSAAVVQAEGGTFDQQEAKDVHRKYDQHAVLAIVTAERPRQGWAFERFTREGPLALLPFPSHLNHQSHPGHPGAGGGATASGRYALVWCCQPDRAAALAAMDDAAFAAELNATFGTRLGTLSVAGPRHSYPLGINVKKQIVDRRLAVIGNAAQTLHPVAGQGLNLGLRDAARLAQALAPALRQTGGDPRPLLAQYALARRADRWLTAGLTDLMPRIFATGFSPIEHACGLALLTLDLSRTVRTPLARQMMEGARA
ncbi:FAD-dependent monooxygenase [Pigmentiphaga litoralis]|uniref:2-octaprenyl-6-methoxyphenol hydroxylase n=1 Tax=Pigmentiphaga litoralis TaxID=516702 RepID=A0A7Y9IUC6_9BURK|nr:FAD-dependent monooxygenase [Pigmentiphaga litoralis]NYE23728.1 2-octaprenyl-6-methoxyphenol hydroxylase [Pigmentiphaga litoralis]NYE82658.1 2-octaprenyl-6-methoxyphenol hydroxylase [Pigmentiphaga litoralis]